MKKILIYTFLIIFIIISCKEEKVELYNSENYISFTNSSTDTIVLSFFLLGNLDEVDYPVVVEYIGIPVETNKEFIVKSDEANSTYSKDYVTFKEEGTFGGMKHLDTLYINFKNYDELKTETKIFTLCLKENDDFILGDKNYRKITFKINNNVAKPDWWDQNVERYYLGEYSDTKFRKLMEYVEPDLSKVDESWIRNWALQFKTVIDRNIEAGTPITEDDGNPMVIPVRM